MANSNNLCNIIVPPKVEGKKPYIKNYTTPDRPPPAAAMLRHKQIRKIAMISRSEKGDVQPMKKRRVES